MMNSSYSCPHPKIICHLNVPNTLQPLPEVYYECLECTIGSDLLGIIYNNRINEAEKKWKNDAFIKIKMAIALVRDRVQTATSELMKLQQDLRSICEHSDISKIEIPNAFDDGYGKFWSDWTYTCKDCSKTERGYDCSLARLLRNKK